MFRTSKPLVGAALAAMLLASGASAEQAETSKKAGPALTALIQAMQKDPGSNDASDLRAQIEERLSDLLSQASEIAPQETKSDLSIKRLDELNRSAERERSALAFEKVRYERMQLEIDKLISLYETVKKLEDDAAAKNAERQKTMQQLITRAAEQTAPSAAASSPSKGLDNMPRIISIAGVAGDLEAQAELTDGTIVTLRKSAIVGDGFEVLDIKPAYVALHVTGEDQEVRLSPRGKKGTSPTMSMPGGVIDLSKIPMAQF